MDAERPHGTPPLSSELLTINDHRGGRLIFLGCAAIGIYPCLSFKQPWLNSMGHKNQHRKDMKVNGGHFGKKGCSVRMRKGNLGVNGIKIYTCMKFSNHR